MWSLDIDEPDNTVLELRGSGVLLTLSSETVNAKVETLASKYRWVFFHEGVFEGTVSAQRSTSESTFAAGSRSPIWGDSHARGQHKRCVGGATPTPSTSDPWVHLYDAA